MDRKSKILFWVFGLLIALSVSASFYRFVVLQDFLVEAEVDCDPSYESCFIWECAPEVDGADVCTGDPEEDTWYFKIAHRNAMNFTQCEEDDEECSPFMCPDEGEEQCDEVLCSAESLSEYDLGDACTDPADFEEKFSDDEEIDLADDEEMGNEEEEEEEETTDESTITSESADVSSTDTTTDDGTSVTNELN